MNINRVCFAGNLTAEPEVNYSPKGSAVVSASIANNEFYGGAGYGVGRISYASCEFTGKHYGYHGAITTTTIVITTKANPTGTTTAPTTRRSTCIC